MKNYVVYAAGLAAAALAVGFAGFQIELRRIPSAIMAKTEARTAASVGGYNAMRHGPRPDGAWRTVVRPSPDQLYSACAYDLKDGPVSLSGRAPDDSYWSLSFFAHNTDNYFVVNDSQIGGEAFTYVIVREGEKAPAGVAEKNIVRSPTRTGMVIQRLFIADEAKAAEIDRRRRETTCQPYAAGSA